MTALQKNNFIEPKEMAELDGDLGVTSIQIAESLGVKPEYINRRMAARGYAEKLMKAGCRVIAIGMATKSLTNSETPIGMTTKSLKKIKGLNSWVFDITAAQVFVAQTRTDLGIAYAKYLTDFHSAIAKKLPELLREMQEMRAELAEWHGTRQKKLLKSTSTQDYVISVKRVTDMFGNPVFIKERIKIPTDKLRRDEYLAAQVSHCIEINEGMGRKIKALNDELEMIRLPADKRE